MTQFATLAAPTPREMREPMHQPSAPVTTDQGPGFSPNPAESSTFPGAARTEPTTAAALTLPSIGLSGAMASGGHSTVAGIPTPLVVAVGAVVLVLVVLLAVTALTRHRDDDEDHAPLELED